MKNFFGAVQVVCGLQKYPVARLKHTWAVRVVLSPIVIILIVIQRVLPNEKWSALEALVSPDRKFAALRAVQDVAVAPLLPHPSFLIRDLTAMEENASTSKNPLGHEVWNLAKLRMIGSVVHRLALNLVCSRSRSPSSHMSS